MIQDILWQCTLSRLIAIILNLGGWEVAAPLPLSPSPLHPFPEPPASNILQHTHANEVFQHLWDFPIEDSSILMIIWCSNSARKFSYVNQTKYLTNLVTLTPWSWLQETISCLSFCEELTRNADTKLELFTLLLGIYSTIISPFGPPGMVIGLGCPFFQGLGASRKEGRTRLNASQITSPNQSSGAVLGAWRLGKTNPNIPSPQLWRRRLMCHKVMGCFIFNLKAASAGRRGYW